MKRCIFYLPYKLEEHGKGARMMRPRKMIQAFREIGYDVFVIEGYSRARKRQIRQLKKCIRHGFQYEFMYAESSTMPILLTDPHHLPLHPFVDFGFFRWMKKRGIPIGLFYCDIYWKFDSYGEALPGWKRFFSLKCYVYDIRQYVKLLDRFYIPSGKLLDYLASEALSERSVLLPPGAEELRIRRDASRIRDFSVNPLHVFYVGGIGAHYQIEALIRAVSRTENCVLTLCCREHEWQKEKIRFEKFLNERIQIVHRNGDELEPYYDNADIGALIFENGAYMNMAMPYKAFEYLGHEIPVIATKDTAIGHFTEQNGTGLVIPYHEDAVCSLLNKILHRPEMLGEKQKTCIETKKQNLWKCRAGMVEKTLSQMKE